MNSEPTISEELKDEQTTFPFHSVDGAAVAVPTRLTNEKDDD